ncbi:ankyrin repeat domain-containing protein [Ilyobacter polytropus]|uniref:Ankyrin n=1 Tax=Ilyobacter polytropus (strain ATCC 51220 / DSM 2926 / LMG 16218 / CuHBu1) TaxID=572544 RepID=E3HB83_ILYPC|nr:ankyrin repeat domain-containing protein [Ilyobacter polytropus]ADO82234.1 Ankyrin [Ilyobacter polytropus DSM 2926]
MKKIVFMLLTILILIGCSNRQTDGGIDIDNVKVTPEDVYTSIFLDDSDSVKLFLDNGFPINYKDELGETLLIKAVKGNSKNVINLLALRGALLEERTFSKSRKNTNITVPGRTAIYFAENLDILNLLVDNGANVNFVNGEGEPLLIYFIKHKPDEYTKLLIKKGAKVNSVDENMWTPLIWAVVNSKEEIVKELIIEDVDLFYRDSQGNYAVYYAFNKNIISLLLEDGYRIKAENKDDETIMGEVYLKCVSNGYYDEVEKLLEMGIDVNYMSYGDSALSLAKENKDAKMTVLLKSRGAVE